ncbi:MAG TPA: signal peptidase II [Gaiellaceae bacterium]
MSLRLAVPLFVAALGGDLLSKEWATGHAAELVYNSRPSELPLRVLMSLVAIGVAAALIRVAAMRGLGRQWGVLVGCTLLVAGVLANGVSIMIWSRGVPDFIDMGDGWIWNVADLEIAIGLSGGIVSVAVSALGVYVREKLARPLV